jgi:hypothetical protein
MIQYSVIQFFRTRYVCLSVKERKTCKETLLYIYNILYYIYKVISILYISSAAEKTELLNTESLCCVFEDDKNFTYFDVFVITYLSPAHTLYSCLYFKSYRLN